MFRAKNGSLERCDEFGRIVPGRERHADWFKEIDHPDARLIAAAPEIWKLLSDLVSDGPCCPFCADAPHRKDCVFGALFAKLEEP